MTPPADLSNIVAIAVGGTRCAALLADSTVRSWGFFNEIDLPSGLTNVIDLAVGSSYTMALKSDGKVVVWGNNFYDITNVPPSLSDVVKIAAASGTAIAVVADHAPLRHVRLDEVVASDSGFSFSIPTQSGCVYALEFKEALEQTEWSTLPLVAGTGEPVVLTDPNSVQGQRFYRVRRW